MKIGIWFCGNGHRFEFGDEDWHGDLNQGMLESVPVPMYCTEDFSADEEDSDIGRYEGEPCMDSSTLILDEVRTI